MIELETAFDIPPEVEELRARVRTLVRDSILPFEREIEESDSMPDEVCRMVRESGLPGLQVPVEYGGMGLGMLAACIVTEELAWSSQALAPGVRGRAGHQHLRQPRAAGEVPATNRRR
jgi:alkylation response protein AidB-like acyl-CoA dehydrogenase